MSAPVHGVPISIELPSTFSLDDIDRYLRARISDSNRKSCIRVLANLLSGKGVTHKGKPGEAFLEGHIVCPADDLDELRVTAAKWLPYSGPDCLDKGHGWALNHPIQKLIDFKNHCLLGRDVEAQAKAAIEKKRKRDPVQKIRILKGLLDEGCITADEYDAKKAKLLDEIV